MSQRKLLLADDSITIQKVVNLTFADEGIEVITVGDGDSAMQKIAEIVPDLVMADVNMPGLSGYEVCENIRRSEHLKNTPVILLVGSFEPFDEEKARSVGADDFLTKPFQSIRQLVSKVTDLLNGETSRNGEGHSKASTTTSEVMSSDSDVEPQLANAETLRNFSSSPAGAETSAYGDAGMDDEMIETNRGDNFASSESDYRQVSEPEFESKTQPLNAEDIKEFSFAASTSEQTLTETVETDEAIANDYSEETDVETVSDYSDETEQVAAQTEYDSEDTSESKSEISAENIENSSPMMFDFSDDNLLEIPFDEDNEDEAETIETAQEFSPVDSSTADNETENTENYIDTTGAVQLTENEQTGSVANDYQTSATNAEAVSQLSPEMIEAIAQRVVEKLSDKAVKDVAWEVVPDMADLIIKKMAEEKLKE